MRTDASATDVTRAARARRSGPACRALPLWLLAAVLASGLAGALRADPASSSHPPRGASAGHPRAAAAAAGRRAGGRVVILPGIANLEFEFAGLVKRLRAKLPGFDVEIRRWGPRLRLLHNLRAERSNRAAARALAAELAEWRAEHPGERLYLVGYSGGGGIAALATAELPAGVRVDRLILVAAAISPGFPFSARTLPHVAEFAANFSSERDWQVDWGTRTFGTIDRVKTASAGADGFSRDDDRLLEYRWSRADLLCRHHGHHLSYLRPRWQDAKLLPALDPALTARGVAQRWRRGCGKRRAGSGEEPAAGGDAAAAARRQTSAGRGLVQSISGGPTAP